jgi:glycosyltransferase involved in cell wall biosynthesis
MKILHVITSLAPGGAEHLMVDLLPRLKNLGHDVEIAVFNSKKTYFYNQLIELGIKIHDFSEIESVYSFKHILRLKRLMKDFDIVHTHNTACQMFAVFGKTKKNKLVTTEHSTSTRRRNYRVFYYIDRWMYRKYDKIICIAKPSEENLRSYIGNDYPISTICNGIDVNRFANAAQIDLGLGDYKIVTMVAGFRYEKDQPTLIRAITHLPENYHLLLVGDGEKRSEIELLIAELKIQHRVHLLGLRNDVPQILRSSDVIVMSSHREGLSLSNVEGMASGKPFIASDVEGLKEVTEGYGELFPYGNDKELANIILKLTTNEEYCEYIVNKCKKRAMQYDISTMVENYNNVYENLIREF